MSYYNTYTGTTLASFPPNGKADLVAKFCQRTAPSWDGDQTPGGENAQKNCGMTALAAAIYQATGVYISPDALKGLILDYAGGNDQLIIGPTTIDMLRKAANDVAQMPTTVLTPTTTVGNASGSLLELVWARTKGGFPVQELRWWDHPNSGSYHWATAVGLDPTYVYMFDPWVGQIIVETWDTHRAMFLGASIPGGGIFSYDRPRDPYLDTIAA